MITLDWKKDAVKALHLRQTPSGLRVLDAQVLSPDQLRKWLSKRGREEIRVAGTFQRWNHKSLHVPAVRSALQEIVAREGAQLVGEDAEVCFQEIGEEEIQGEKKLKLMAAVVAREELEALAKSLFVLGVEPRLMTTTPLAVQLLLQERGYLSQDPVAFLEVEAGKSTLFVFRGNEIRVVRALPHGNELAVDDLKKLVGDIQQTFFFHGAKFRGESVRKLVVSGTFPGRGALELLARELEVEVVPLELGEWVTATDAVRVAGFATGLGLARVSGKSSLVLEPPSLRALRRGRRQVRRLALGVAATILMLVVPGALLSRQSQEMHVLESTAQRDIARY